MIVSQIPSAEAIPWILQKHYARRIPPIQFAFGLFENNVCTGIVTYGIPASKPLSEGICGKELASNLIELNRLCIESKIQNAASFLVSHSLKLLPPPKIIVSFADMKMGHVGYVYQAANFLYTGLSADRTDFLIEGQEHRHGRLAIDRHGSVKAARKIYGDKIRWVKRSRKHRYVFFVGNKTEVKVMRKALNYPIQPYPKGETKRYDASAPITTQSVLF